jgi:aspartyl-tRNA(Asn)/glutamyl-tRNA(Gln) amidotransferase subunit B
MIPEPDLPPLKLSKIQEFSREVLEKNMPILPWDKRVFYQEMGLNDKAVEHYVSDRRIGSFFDSVAGLCADDKKLIALSSNYISSDLSGLDQDMGEKVFDISPDGFTELMRMLMAGEVSSRAAKDILHCMVKGEEDPRKIAGDRDLFQKSSTEALEAIARAVIKENEEASEAVRAGKEETVKFLVGCGMKKSSGSANPNKLREIILSLIHKREV